MSFVKSESGAVTVEWVVLTAGLVGLGLATLTVVASGVEDVSADIDGSLKRNDIIVTSFGSSLTNGDFSAGYEEGSIITVYSAMEGWTQTTSIQALAAGYNGTSPPSGGIMLDMDNNTAPLSISQTVADLRPGQTTTVSFEAADIFNHNSTFANNVLEVEWGGEVIATIDPTDSSWSTYEFELTGGAGDGSNTLTFSDLGEVDQAGMYLANVTIE